MTRQGLYRAFLRLLPFTFVFFDAAQANWLVGLPLGCDAIVYVRGAAAFLAGQDPWGASLFARGVAGHFAGLPPTVLLFVPFTALAETATALFWVGLSAVSAVLILRRLRLPVWWLAYPPLAIVVYAGNPQLPLLALILYGGGWLAPVLKAYAFLPLFGERRWKALAGSLAVFVGSLALVPGLWLDFFRNASTITANQMAETGGGLSAWGQPWPLLVATIIALTTIAALDMRAAGWLAVPAIWPGSQLTYATMVLPLTSPILAFAMMLNIAGLPGLIVIGYAAMLVVDWRRSSAQQRRHDRLVVRRASEAPIAGGGRADLVAQVDALVEPG